jgi:hypothetical protein
MTQRAASLAGCGVRACSIGAVATYQEYRGRGHASAAFQDACDHAAAEGVDVMWISGGRGLYVRVGCRQVGQDWDFIVEHDGARALSSDAYSIASATAEDIPTLRALHNGEGTRFLRPLEDWQMAFSCGVVMNTASDFWTVSLNSAGPASPAAAGGGPDDSRGTDASARLPAGRGPVAYLIVHQPDKLRSRRPEDPRQVRVVEFAGDRAAVVAALPKLLERYDAGRATIHVQGTDPALAARLHSTGLQGKHSGASGTTRVINFPQLMDHCRPLLVERLGADTASALAFEADERPGSASGAFHIRLGAELLTIPDLATLGLYLFGAPDRSRVVPEGSARLGELLGPALPLPSLWYGINYV